MGVLWEPCFGSELDETYLEMQFWTVVKYTSLRIASCIPFRSQEVPTSTIQEEDDHMQN